MLITVIVHVFLFFFPLGAVSLAGTDSGLWAVVGGNKLVCSGLLYSAKAQLIQGTVTSVQEKVRSTKPGECDWHDFRSR